MSRTFKALLLSSAALTTSLGAAAEADDLESRIAALEAMVSELKSELAASRSPPSRRPRLLLRQMDSGSVTRR